MRHTHLRAFHHVALCGGFSQAAALLGVSQPVISEQVRLLEQEHDVLLFDRSQRKVRLTTAGAALLVHTEHYFEAERRIAEHLSAAGAAVEGELRIIADAAHHITDLLSRFRARYPQVTVTLSAGNTEDILDRLRRYDAEIGVVGSPPISSDLETLTLSTTEIVAFASRGMFPPDREGLSIADLARLPLVWREPGSKTRQKLAEEALRRGVSLRPAVTAEGREAVHELVASGAGVGFVSRAEYREDPRLACYPITDTELSMTEVMVHLRQRRDVRLIRAFMDMARQEIPAAP